MTHPKYVLKSIADDLFYFVLTEPNGKIVLTSQTFTTKSKALRGIVTVQINSSNDERYFRNKASDDQYYFNVKANNGQIIGTSEMYSTSEARDAGMQTVKQSGRTQEVEDLSFVKQF